MKRLNTGIHNKQLKVIFGKLYNIPTGYLGSMRVYFFKLYTVEPPLMDLPRSWTTFYSEQAACYGFSYIYLH